MHRLTGLAPEPAQRRDGRRAVFRATGPVAARQHDLRLGRGDEPFGDARSLLAHAAPEPAHALADAAQGFAQGLARPRARRGERRVGEAALRSHFVRAGAATREMELDRAPLGGRKSLGPGLEALEPLL